MRELGLRLIIVDGSLFVTEEAIAAALRPLTVEAFAESHGMSSDDVHYLLSRGILVATTSASGAIELARSQGAALQPRARGGGLIDVGEVASDLGVGVDEVHDFLASDGKRSVVVAERTYIFGEDFNAMIDDGSGE